MSILLDALKKSDEQRQRGSATARDSAATPPAAGNSSGRKWVLLALLAVSVVLAAWLGWQHYRQADSGPVSGSTAESQQTAAPGAGQVKVAADAEPEPPTRGGRQRTPVETFAAEDKSSTVDSAARAVESAPAALDKSEVNQSFTEFEAPPEPDSGSTQAPPVGAQPAISKTAAPKPVAKQGRPARPPATATEPITYWELPQGIRDGLPDLRITVLVFAERPEDRFVLIGGKRRVENDRLQEGLVLEEIRRDGVVFTYRNYRFLVKG